MKWALLIVGSLVGLLLVIAVIGAMLPRDHVATMTATIAGAPDKVWAVLTDVATYPTWRSEVRKVDVLSTAPLTWKEHTTQGDMTLATEIFEPPSRMVGRIQDRNMPFGGAWEYRITPVDGDPGKSRVTITERGWVSNPVFRFMSRFVIGHYSTLDSYLKSLGRKFGTDVTPVRA